MIYYLTIFCLILTSSHFCWAKNANNSSEELNGLDLENESYHHKHHNISKRQTSDSSVCNSNECNYGYCEVISPSTYLCHCFQGITGTNCNVRSSSTNPCISNPCYGAGSTCIQSGTSYVCNCGSGLGGPACNATVGSCQCVNGGTCYQTIAGSNFYQCRCPTGYGGLLCQYRITQFVSCSVQGCRNNGVCNIAGKCNCPSGYTGNFCELIATSPGQFTTSTTSPFRNLNQCSPGVCLNGGTCIAINTNSAYCQCITGFAGQYCESFSNTLTSTTTTSGNRFFAQCTTGICQNNGQCYQVAANFAYCQCASGYSGQYCQTGSTLFPTQTSSTQSNQFFAQCYTGVCQNNGQCQQIATNLALCQCANGFSGQYCQIGSTQFPTTSTTPANRFFTQCTTGICQNGGFCYQIATNMASCVCLPGFTGQYCESSTTQSSTTPSNQFFAQCYTGVCQNNGQCQQIATNMALCQCANGFSGQYCQISPTLFPTSSTTPSSLFFTQCSPGICQNGGQCTAISSTLALCQCASGYSGQYCQTRSNFCASNPCKNSNSCITGADGFTGYCVCQPSYTGDLCDVQLNACSATTCKNNQPCIVDNGVPKCLCAAIYQQPDCS